MGFEAILGNDRLKENLTVSLSKGRISHFYLISGPAGSGKRTLARLLASAILCRGADKPCGACLPCRKVMKGEHPDLITVEDPEHKNVAVRIVRQIRDDVFIRPNESDHKIYLCPQELGLEGQNALLKILEEPPAYGVFILLADNPEKLLPTVRSRCTELALTAVPAPVLRRHLSQRFPEAVPEDIDAAVQRSGGWLGQALELLENGENIPPQTENFAAALAGKDPLLMAQTLAPMEKWKRDALAEILQSWLELTEEALTCRSGIGAVSAQAEVLGKSRPAAELYAVIRTLKKALEYTMGNVSPAAVCGWLMWELR